ncbi:MAG: hypothetical protein PHD37_07465 [Gallionellaceae bacterium]|nr:hypothetical protein [Gallionellaceae bacterium]
MAIATTPPFLTRLAVTLLVCLMNHPVSAAENIVLLSSDILKPGVGDIASTVTISPLSSRIYSIKHKFNALVKPMVGIDPTAVHFVTFCIAGHTSKKHGFNAWALGEPKSLGGKNPATGASEAEFIFAIGNEGESPSLVAESDSINWDNNSFNPMTPQFNEYCRSILRAEYMWD